MVKIFINGIQQFDWIIDSKCTDQSLLLISSRGGNGGHGGEGGSGAFRLHSERPNDDDDDDLIFSQSKQTFVLSNSFFNQGSFDSYLNMQTGYLDNFQRNSFNQKQLFHDFDTNLAQYGSHGLPELILNRYLESGQKKLKDRLKRKKRTIQSNHGLHLKFVFIKLFWFRYVLIY